MFLYSKYVYCLPESDSTYTVLLGYKFAKKSMKTQKIYFNRVKKITNYVNKNYSFCLEAVEISINCLSNACNLHL